MAVWLRGHAFLRRIEYGAGACKRLVGRGCAAQTPRQIGPSRDNAGRRRSNPVPRAEMRAMRRLKRGNATMPPDRLLRLRCSRRDIVGAAATLAALAGA